MSRAGKPVKNWWNLPISNPKPDLHNINEDIEDLDLILKERRLRWYGHVELSNGAVKTAFDIQVDGKRGPGRPKMTWKQLTERDCIEWKLSAINPHDRYTWRSGVRSAMGAASQLSGRGSTGVGMLPLYLHINQKSDYDMIMIWSMNIPKLVKIHWHSLKLSSGRKLRVDVWQTDR